MKNPVPDQAYEFPSSFTDGMREHVKLGPKIYKTVKRKLSLGARIVQGGGSAQGLQTVIQC
ncbi:hypothetical protein IFM89_039942 [Coptis chinensis]|uniref:Uncharacterized protein n=1 Tax=Coptis chinensis TaxID=261450 RepID=A0A835LGU6_9MAGN|nr:hypothetical protein IFM89_039942 [Coptis chinensis]